MMKIYTLLIIILLSASAFAADLPRIAVYVTGNIGDDEKKVTGTRLLASLVNSGRYKGIERSNSFLAEIEKEQIKQRSGEIDDSQISALGKQFGVKFVCIADITRVLGAFQISARIVDVETAEVAFIGESYSALKNIVDLVSVCDQVVKNMFGGEAATIRQPTFQAKQNLAPKPEPKPEPAAQEPPPPAVSQATAEPPKPQPKPEPAAQEPPPPAVSQTAAEPPKPQPKPKPEPEPKPKAEPKEKPAFKISAGGGVLLAANFGGGIEYANNGQKTTMPYTGGGAYLFLDAVYAEASAGFSTGGGVWNSGGDDETVKNGNPDMPRSYINIGALAKYPFDAGNVKIFPLLGLDYEAAISGKLKYEDGTEYPFDGKNGFYTASALSALWVKFGGGADIGLGQTLYLRAELLYGFRTANGFEKEEIKNRNDKKTIPASGLTFKAGAGVKF